MKIKLKSIISFVLVFLVVFLSIPFSNIGITANASSIFNSGSGTSLDPYMISTATQLKAFAASVNSGNSYVDKYIQLENDIIINKTSDWKTWENNPPANKWVPIGNGLNIFRGVFDGMANDVVGIFISTTDNYQGLFGNSSGTIKNLYLVDSYIKGGQYTGGIAGYAKIIDNCSNFATIKGGEYTGGIAGKAGTITNSHNYGKISTDSTKIGGIAGSLNTKIDNCHNFGSLTSSFGSFNAKVGGIVGEISDYTEASIKNSSNYADISAQGEKVGGICGDLHDVKEVEFCFNIGKVSGKTFVGGIAGYSSKSTFAFKNSYNTGDVSGNNYVGGIVGGYGTIAYCYNIGKISANTSFGPIVSNSSASDSYYLNTSVNNPTNTSGISRSEEEMKKEGSFSGFDFKNVWLIQGYSSYKYPKLKNNMPLGALRIEGLPVFGKKLKARHGEGSFEYQWYRNDNKIEGATAKDYEVKVIDIGKKIHVSLTHIDSEGKEVITISTSLVPTKATHTKTLTPTTKNISSTSITLTKYEGYEYKMGTDGKWQDKTLFDNLKPNQSYTFYQRIAETDTHFESSISEAFKVSTLKTSSDNKEKIILKSSNSFKPIKADVLPKGILIKSDMTAKNVKALAENKDLIVKNKDGKEIKDGELVGSGATLNLIKDSKIIDSYTIVVLGDTNGDAKITAADARLALRMSARLETPTVWQKPTADVDNSGKITSADARQVLRVSAKLDSFKL